MMTCRANRIPKLDRSAVEPLGAFVRILNYEPCGEPATHVAYGHTAMCPKHAEEARVALRSADCVMNIRIGRGRTESEIEMMIRPIHLSDRSAS